jgi:hypothetical protein
LTSLKPSVCFLVDTREQQPLAFGPAVRTDYFSCATTRLAALREGDYGVALNGRPLLSIRLERKSLGDLHGRVGFQRARFEAELRRLRAYDYRGIIIQATLDELTPGYQRLQISPRAALGSPGAWSVLMGSRSGWPGTTRRRRGCASGYWGPSRLRC